MHINNTHISFLLSIALKLFKSIPFQYEVTAKSHPVTPSGFDVLSLISTAGSPVGTFEVELNISCIMIWYKPIYEWNMVV